MAKQKIDGVVEGVRYTPNGQVDWVRAYEKRGPTFSDVVLIQRDELIRRMQSGKKFFIGRRKIYQASEFDISGAVRLVEQGGKTALVVNEGPVNQDHLDGAPII